MEIRKQSFFTAPDFWKSTWEEVEEFLDALQVGQVWEIGRSQGGRPIRAVAYGEFEPVERRTTYSSAIASGHPEDFYDPDQREKPVLLIIGAIHAVEIEGTVACINLAHVLEQGTDLRGRDQPVLSDLAGRMRIVMVPLPQPDGRIRAPVRNLRGGSVDDLYYYGQGVMADGTILRWPECKRLQPVPVEEMRFVGGYYNDAGVNIQHDDFFAPQVAPETRALLDLARAETPDAFLTLHSCGSGPFLIGPDAHISPRCQFHQARIGALIAERHRRDGLRPGGGPGVEVRGGFFLHTALHFASGALPLLFELPHGLEMKPFTFEEILDAGLDVLEEVMRYGAIHRYGPR